MNFTHKLLSRLPSSYGKHGEVESDQIPISRSLEFFSAVLSVAGLPNFDDAADKTDAVNQEKGQHWAVEEYELATFIFIDKAHCLADLRVKG